MAKAPIVPFGDAAVRTGYNGTLMSTLFSFDILDRMVEAVEKVRQRMERAAAALTAAGVPYAVVGGNAVASWVSRSDASLVRNTQDVGILIRRADLPAATAALGTAGFIYRHAAGIDLFLDGPAAKARDAVHVVFAGEKVRPEYVLAAPEVTESEPGQGYQVLNLDALVRMKLTSFRRKDQVHIQDLIAARLVDETWCDRLPPALADRLRELLADPDG
jgi:hypothetical protein